jgi:hypothetical protein
MSKRLKKIIKIDRTLSWSFTAITAVMLTTGYSMTFVGVVFLILRILHFVFDTLFTLAFIFHVIIKTFIIRFKWKPIISSILSGKANNNLKLRFLQHLSSLGLFITVVLQVVSGLDWFKLGLSRFLPYQFTEKSISLYLSF